MRLTVWTLVIGLSLIGCSTPHQVELVWESASIRVIEAMHFHASVAKGPHQEWQTINAIVISPGRLQNQKMQFLVPLNSVWSDGSEYRVLITQQRDPNSEGKIWLLRHDPNLVPEAAN